MYNNNNNNNNKNKKQKNPGTIGKKEKPQETVLCNILNNIKQA